MPIFLLTCMQASFSSALYFFLSSLSSCVAQIARRLSLFLTRSVYHLLLTAFDLRSSTSHSLPSKCHLGFSVAQRIAYRTNVKLGVSSLLNKLILLMACTLLFWDGQYPPLTLQAYWRFWVGPIPRLGGGKTPEYGDANSRLYSYSCMTCGSPS